MKKFSVLPHAVIRTLPLLFITVAILFTSCKKDQEPVSSIDDGVSVQARGGGHDDNDDDALRGFMQTNLVSNSPMYSPVHTDPALINGWGIAFSATGTPWVSSQGGHSSNVYTSEGVTVLGPVLIPSPGGPEGGNPTGAVFNPLATDFLIPAGNGTAAAAARFIFVGVDGIVSAWNPTWGTHAFAQFNHSGTSSYTGLTLAANNGSNFLYAADFHAKRIVVWDKTWTPVSMNFRDPNLPWGYSPFNIQAIGEYLYVTYAKVNHDGRSRAGEGLGIVNIFRTNGKLVKRFASHNKLNAPWGITMAPASFFPQDAMDNDDDDDHSGHGHDGNGNNSGNAGGHYRHGDDDQPQPAILVGNFGDGHINAFSLKGEFLGQLRAGKHALVIDGLWALSFAPGTSTIDPNRLYFAAGPDAETNGLFGYILKK